MNENEKLWCKLRKQKDDARRYYLHSLVKKSGYKIDVRLKTIYIPFNQTELHNSVKSLRDVFNYSVQTEIV